MFQTKDMEYRNISLPWMPEHYAMTPHLVEKTLKTEQVWFCIKLQYNHFTKGSKSSPVVFEL